MEEFDKKTIRIRKIYLAPFFKWLQDRTPTIELAQEYVIGLKKSDHTKFRIKIAIKHFYQYLNDYEDHDLKVNRIKLKQPIYNIRSHVTPEDFEKIDSYIHTIVETRKEVRRLHTIVHLMWETGLRRCEILNIELKNLDLDEKMFAVCSPKSDRWRLGYFEYDLKPYISEFRPRKYLFELCDTRVSSFITQTLKKAIPDKKLTAHSFRHGAVTRWVNNGMPLEMVKSLAGHVKTDTTLAYLHLYGNQIKDAYRTYNRPPKIIEIKSRVGLLTKYDVEIKLVKNNKSRRH